MRFNCSCKRVRCSFIALMSLFVMGFQFMPDMGVLALKDKQALGAYAETISKPAELAQKSGKKKEGLIPWLSTKFSLPEADFGLDALYGLDKQSDDTYSGRINF